MNKTIQTTQLTNHYHPAFGPLFKVTFTDNTTALLYAETFFDQVRNWEPGIPLDGVVIDMNVAYEYEEPKIK